VANPGDDASESSTDTEEALTSGGCEAKALKQTLGDGYDSLINSTLDSDLMELQTQADEDSRVVAATRKWSDCMSRKGFDYNTPQDAQEYIHDRYVQDSEEVRSDAELEALRTTEINTATADAACRDSAGLDRVSAEVKVELETEYYQAHKAEVDAYFTQLEAFLKKS
jgi:hypothetical protein